MNYYDIVPMITEPQQLDEYTTLRSGQGWNAGHKYMGKYIEDLMLKEMGRVREQNPEESGLWFSTEIMPGWLIEGLRKKDPIWFSRGKGQFSASEVNDLLRRDYDSSLYNLGQAKARATATQNILDMILGQ